MNWQFNQTTNLETEIVHIDNTPLTCEMLGSVAQGRTIQVSTDTIASMTGAIAGAHHGEDAIPPRWLDAITETAYTPDRMRQLADQLLEVTLAQV